MISCSFCGYTEEEAAHVFAGPMIGDNILAICSCCVRYCEVQGHLMDLDARKRERKRRGTRSVCDGWLWQGESP